MMTVEAGGIGLLDSFDHPRKFFFGSEGYP
jgi:hypothetical protein